MIRYSLTQHIRRTPEAVYDFVAVNQPSNHPKWEPEVVEIRRPGALAVGLRGIMVREEFGKRRDVPFEVVDLVPGRRIAYRSGEGGFDMHLVFDMQPAGSGTDFTVNVELKLSGLLMLMTPLFALKFPKTSKRISARLAEVLDAGAV